MFLALKKSRNKEAGDPPKQENFSNAKYSKSTVLILRPHDKSCAFTSGLQLHMIQMVKGLSQAHTYSMDCLFQTAEININRVDNTTDTQHPVDKLYLLLVPGTTTAPLSSFFLCKNAANLFLVVGGVLMFFLTVVPSTRSGMSISEFNDL